MARTNRINGTPTIDTPTPSKAARKPTPAKLTVKIRGRKLSATPQQALAASLGCVGVVVLGLSLIHSAAAIADLTHQHILLGWALAIGIDCGLVLAECADMIGKGKARTWARWTVGLTIVLSIMLNTHACWSEHETMRTIFAWTLGVVVPVLVFMFGRIATHLTEK